MREDLQHCFAGHPQERFAGAAQLAKQLRSLPERRAELGRRAAEKVVVERAAHRRVTLWRATVAGAFVLLLILGTALGAWQNKQARRAEKERARLRNVQRALGSTLPEIEKAIEKDDYTTAFKLIEQGRPFIGDDNRFQAFAQRVIHLISVQTTPPGAEVFLRDYSDTNAPWQSLGKSPLKELRVPRGVKRWKVTMPEYETTEGALSTSVKPVEVKVTLDKAGTLPPGMVRIEGQKHKADLIYLDPNGLQELNLSDFLLDRFEVSNRKYKEFVDAGGYKKPAYWKHKFVKDGVELSWEEAMKLFVDQSGQPGPATWNDGTFPASQEDYPVGGVSWYEAAAYAEFAGKRLPTVYHWSLAASFPGADVGRLIVLSNFGGEGPAQGGKFQGMSSRGIYDLAGNVKEWCFNQVPDGYRIIAGGGWNEPAYLFEEADKYPAFFRRANFGFRCMKPAHRRWTLGAGRMPGPIPSTSGSGRSEAVFR